MFKEFKKVTMWNKVLKHQYTKEKIEQGQKKLNEVFKIWTKYEILLFCEQNDISNRGNEKLQDFFEDIANFIDDSGWCFTWDRSFMNCLQGRAENGWNWHLSYLDVIYDDILWEEYRNNDPYPRLTRADLGI